MGLQERREKEKDNRRSLILQSARSLFLAKGVRNVTVDEIAKLSELGKGSIYLHFTSKEEICAQILLNDIDRFHQLACDLFNKKKTATDCLFEFSSLYIDSALNEPELFRILITFMLQNDQINLSAEQNKNIIGAMRNTINIIGNIFQFGVDTKEFPNTIDIKISQFAVWGMLNGIITLHIFSGAESKRRGKIYSTIKAALQVYIKGLQQG